MIKMILLLCLTVNLAFGKTRFTEAEKKDLIQDMKEGLADIKETAKSDKLNNEIIKKHYEELLEDLHSAERITPAEIEEFKKRGEAFLVKANIATLENDYKKFTEEQIEILDKKSLEKIKEGQICNNWSCDQGLACAISPSEEQVKSCQAGMRECKENKDCCSNRCMASSDGKKKYCENVSRCFRPLALGQSCLKNPVCGTGECLPYNSRTSGVGECSQKGNSCKINSDCCSNSCVDNKCVESYICKNCVRNGSKPSGGKKCCEGLYLNENGICIPDMPPTQIPQVKNNTIDKKLHFFMQLFVAEAMAGDDSSGGLATDEELAKMADKAKSDYEVYAKALADPTTKPEDLAKLKAAGETSEMAYHDALNHIRPDENDDVAAIHDSFVGSKRGNSSFKGKESKIKGANLEMTRRSKFETCDIRLRDDLFYILKTSSANREDPSDITLKPGEASLHDLEASMVAFDYMFLGSGTSDYWTSVSGSDKTSIYNRLKAIARKHRDIKTEQNIKIDQMNDRLTCMCLAAQGIANVKDPKKIEFWKASCKEEAANQKISVCSKRVECTKDELNDEKFKFSCDEKKTKSQSCDPLKEKDCECVDRKGVVNNEGASGVQGKKLIVAWTKSLEDFHQELTKQNAKFGDDFKDVNDWVGKVDWNKTDSQPHFLYSYVIRVRSKLAMIAAVFTVGLVGLFVLMVMGGGTSAVAFGAGATLLSVLLASQNGAWTQKPRVSDDYQYTKGCGGKLYKCKTYKRTLIQPYSKICNKNISSNACVKNFSIVKNFSLDNEPSSSVYVIDPWIPLGVDAKTVLMSNASGSNYAEKLDESFYYTLSYMKNLSPGTIKDTRYENNQNFFNGPLRDERGLTVTQGYFSKIKPENAEYELTDKAIAEIKEGAKKFAIAEKFLEENDRANLDAFADYAFKFHFVYPKQANPDFIGYPTVGLTNYINHMTNDVSYSLGVGTTKVANTFSKLNSQYLEDYLKNLQLYSDTVGQEDKVGLQFRQQEIDSVKAELDNMNNFIAAISNPNYDGKDSARSTSLSSKTSGSGSGSGSGLTNGQRGFLQAIGTLRSARKAQLKKLETYKKAMASNGDKNRTNKMLQASNQFSKSFSKGLSGMKGGGFGSSSTGLGGSGLNDQKNAANEDKANKKEANGLGADALGLGGQAGGFGSFSDLGKSSGSKNGDGADGAGGAGANGAGDGTTNGMSEEDRKKLAEAIEARDRANKNKYNSQDDQTLFEKVTNAYIRNYDKVLSKKKDKDIIDKK